MSVNGAREVLEGGIRIVKLEFKGNKEFRLGKISGKFNLSINISTIVT